MRFSAKDTIRSHCYTYLWMHLRDPTEESHFSISAPLASTRLCHLLPETVGPLSQYVDIQEQPAGLRQIDPGQWNRRGESPHAVDRVPTGVEERLVPDPPDQELTEASKICPQSTVLTGIKPDFS
jgi:hypothetical protein